MAQGLRVDEETATIVVQELMGSYRTLEMSVSDARTTVNPANTARTNFVAYFKVNAVRKLSSHSALLFPSARPRISAGTVTGPGRGARVGRVPRPGLNQQ